MAIDDLLDEHEQGERVKAWLRENGTQLILGIVVALAAIFGWNRWQAHRADSAQIPGARYQAGVNYLQAGNTEQAQEQLSHLSGSSYATLLSLDLAAKQLEQGQRDAAITTLAGIRDNDPALQAIVNQRHARLLLDAGKHNEAASVIGSGDDVDSLHVRGDIAMATDNTEQAREHYLKAYNQAEVGSPQREVLELKLSEVGGVPAASEQQGNP